MIIPVALTIAGSDSGGGAGVQADLRTFARLGVHGTAAITAVTAQNLFGVREVSGLEPTAVTAQIAAVLEGFEVGAVKTGMLWRGATARAVADALGRVGAPLVVDPVLSATRGGPLLDEVAALSALLPRAALITPNLDEAAALLGEGALAEGAMERAARDLGRRHGCAVLLKGGHLAGDPVDLLSWEEGIVRWRHPRVAGVDTHGTGCVLSAAITALLARGHGLVEACAGGLGFVLQALSRPTILPGGRAVLGIDQATPDASLLVREAG